MSKRGIQERKWAKSLKCAFFASGNALFGVCPASRDSISIFTCILHSWRTEKKEVEDFPRHCSRLTLAQGRCAIGGRVALSPNRRFSLFLSPSLSLSLRFSQISHFSPLRGLSFCLIPSLLTFFYLFNRLFNNKALH